VGYNRMQWQDRAHFFAVSAQVMRRILVDHARRHNVKRGAGVQHVDLEEAAVVAGDRTPDLVALDDAMNALARLDPRKVRIIEMRFFGGLSAEETAEVLNVSPATVRREWSIAKQVYVALHSGWFSTRSAAYLASGRPVVVQDTGWSTLYPTGEGLFAFTTIDEAAGALATIESDYARHARAARAVAEHELDAARVLTQLLRDVE